jgi:hypothetical protein
MPDCAPLVHFHALGSHRNRITLWSSAVLPRILVFLVVLAALLPSSSSAQSDDCADYDSWEWAQSIYDQQPSIHDGLDPDGNGIACDELPRGGFAPAWWTDTIPTNVIEKQVIDMPDGDTLNVTINGQPDTVRTNRLAMAGALDDPAMWMFTASSDALDSVCMTYTEANLAQIYPIRIVNGWEPAGP